ncbi:transamidase [Holotrichia oblita]|nr:transamidase [Holotrichia oblita]
MNRQDLENVADISKLYFEDNDAEQFQNRLNAILDYVGMLNKIDTSQEGDSRQLELYKYSAHELHDKLLKKEVSAVEIAQAQFDRIEAVEDKVKAYITLTKDLALTQAGAIDQKIAQGEKISPLAGIPVAIKDNICTKGIKTTCASRTLAEFVPPYDATVISKLAGEGFVMTGKTNLDEFAVGNSTENSAYFTTQNPWDLTRTPGGSSGGSAAAVAAGQAVLALGSDTGGSIRQPAAYCGLVGLKPTYGLVSRCGATAFASSLDQVGPLTRNVTDCALALNAIAGYDPNDSTSINAPIPDYTQALAKEVKGLKIGLPKEYFGSGIDSEIQKAVYQAVDKLTALGATCEEVTMPHTEYAASVYHIIAPAEGSSNLSRYDGVGFGYRAESENLNDMYKKSRSQGFGSEVKFRIMLGTYVLSSGHYETYYLKAIKVRTLVKEDFDKVFEKVDVLLTPTTPAAAFKTGENLDFLSMYIQDACAIPASLAGMPAISIPCGFTGGNLPIGLQIIGKPLGEMTILRTAYAFEQANNYHDRLAPLGGEL